jgi:DNA-binding winged helix-turn-helix (wHTH) protein/Tol biopolymer transport system component
MSDEFRLGPWLVQPSQNTISNNGNTTRLEPKMVEVLVCLAERPGETLSKEQLIRKVWGDTFVTDDVLTRCISELRKALADDPRAPRVIETVSRKGYRLLEKVERVEPVQSALPGSERKWAWKWWVAGAACLGLVAIGFWVLGSGRTPRLFPTGSKSQDRPVTFVVQPPPGRMFGRVGPIRLSPDGNKLALFTADSSGQALWLRHLNSSSLQQLPGTEGVERVDDLAWSSDSRYLLFVVNGKLKKADTAGGLPETLCDIQGMSVETWGPSDTVLLSRSLLGDSPSTPMKLLSLTDCSMKPLPLDQSGYDYGTKWAHFLPDGEHFLYAGLRNNRQHDVLLGKLVSQSSELLVHDASDPRYVEPGYLFFQRRGYLFAQPFSVGQLRLTGEPIPVVSRQLSFGGLGGIASYDVSGSVLVYQTQEDVKHHLFVADWSGKPLETLDSSAVYAGLRLSPDGKKLLASKADVQAHSSDLWIYDLEHKNWERASFEASKADHWGLWSRDGATIVYAAAVDAHYNLYRVSAYPPYRAAPLLANELDNLPTDFTPDGRFLLYAQLASQKGDLWLMPMEESSNPSPLTETPFDEGEGRFSPDGRWIVYSSDESGTREIYVRSFSRPARLYRISWGGGRLPQWSHDGKRIYYLTPSEKLMEVSVRPGASFRAGPPHFLFAIPGESSEYEVLPNRRFLINEQLTPWHSAPTVVLNWTSVLRR